MEFRLLGLFEVSESGRAVELPRGKERALVTLLLLHPNEPVPTDRLVEELWVERPPANAAKTVQVYVSRLRKSIGMARLQTTPAGYVLRVDAGELDSERFERLAREGRERLDAGEPERAEQLLSDALSLWRGPPLADFRFESFAQAEVRRLEQLRGGVVADRVEARLAQGRAEGVVAELKELIAQNPHWERPRAQLMLALYRSRRQAEALDAYQEARTSLVGELGIEPSRELRELQQAILNQEPVLDLVVPHAREPKSARGVFVGREAELAALIAGLEEALAGRGRLFLLVGEPGIGKSRLADELIDRARARGARVLVGRCWEAGGAPAYWPWVQALRAYIRDCDSEVLREQLGDGAAELPQLFPELHRLIPGLPAPASLASEGARFRLFDAMAGFLKNAAAERPFVLVLDDLHAADEPSLLLLQFVARELAVSRLVIVGAYRDVDPTVRDPLAATLAELAREPVTRRIALAGLTGSDVAEYIALTAGFAPDPAIASEIHAQTEGNPLFVEELARLLIAEGALQGGVVPSRIGIPPGVRDVIGRRLRRLSETSQRVLTFASVLGQEFRLDALARLSELPERALLDPLDEAMAAGVVSDAPGASGQLRFAHSLIRDALYQDLTPARRLQLHAQAGEMLEALYANRLESHLAELAHHFVEAAPVGNVEKAVTYASRAGDRAGELLAFEEAARLYRLALSLTEANDLAGRRRRCELLVVLGDVQARAGDMAAARETLLKAAEIADGIGSGELLARAALGYGGRFVFTRGAEDHRLVPMLEQALARFGEEESPLRVRVLARLASALRSRGSPEPSDSLSAQALEIARRLGDPATLAYAISGRLWATLRPEELDERWSLASELAQAGDRERAFEGHAYRTIVLLARGDVAGIHNELAVMARLADELAQPSQRWQIAATGATLALLEGRLSDAEELIAHAHTVGERAQAYDTRTFFQLQRFALRREQGRLSEILPDLERASESDPTRPLFRCVLALVYHQLGRQEDARSLCSALAADDFAQLTVNNDWLLSAALLAELTASANEIDAADALYRRLTPYDGLNVDTIEVSTGSVCRYLGLLAATIGRLDKAEHHLEDALIENERIGGRPWLAHAQEDYARMLLERDEPGDQKRACGLLADALAAYRELGMESHAAGAVTLSRKVPAPGGTRRSP